MKYIRIIPRLDIKGPNLVKGVHLEGLRVLGKPEEFALVYYEQKADELIFLILFQVSIIEIILQKSLLRPQKTYSYQLLQVEVFVI